MKLCRGPADTEETEHARAPSALTTTSRCAGADLKTPVNSEKKKKLSTKVKRAKSNDDY